jgi:hypothetical protein
MIDYPKAMFNEHLVDSIVCGYSLGFFIWFLEDFDRSDMLFFSPIRQGSKPQSYITV